MVSAHPVPQGVLPNGPRCVLHLRFSLALSIVLHCPLWGFMLPPRPFRGVWGCLSYPILFSAGWGRWLSFAPCCRWCPISGCTSLWLRVFGDSWFSPLCSPDRRSASRFTCPVLPPVGRLSFRLGVFSFGWGFRLFLSVLLAPWGCRCTCCLPSMRLRVIESSSLSAWSFPFRGLSLFLAFVPLLEALSESLTHSIPRSFLVVA